MQAPAGTEVRVPGAVALVPAAFGIYLGRNIRASTWDALHPWSLVAKVVRHLREPGRAVSAAGFTVVAGALSGLVHLVVIGPLVRAALLLAGGAEPAPGVAAAQVTRLVAAAHPLAPGHASP